MLHADILGERARLTPGRLALVDVATGARLTFAQLDARATGCAGVLRRRLGLAKGDRFGILAANRIEYLDLVFGAAKSGTIVVPLGTRLTAGELQPIVADSGMRALAYDEAFADAVDDLRRTTDVECFVALDRGAVASERDRSYARLVSEDTASPPFARERCDPDDLIALLYTSGTTGRPKGVMIPHRMFAWNGYNTVACWQLRDDDVSPIFTPLYHAGGLTVFLTPMIVIGGTVVLHKGFDAGEIWRTIESERCTVALGVPTIWKMLMEAPEFARADLSSVRLFMSGGAPLPEYIARAYQERGVVFKQGYGLTEVGVNCFATTVADSRRKPTSIGRPLMMTEARLVDEYGNEAAPDGIGELLLRGPHVCSGYWNNPAATAAALDADGWFHTGDLARTDEDGFFYIAGRRKDMFISGGVNVYPAEIESALLQHPAIADAAVAGIPDDRWGEVGVAFVVLRTGHAVSEREFLAFLEPRLARYKLPKRFVVTEALPRTAYGKVQKPTLVEQFLKAKAGSR